jgi:hypothetical protein
VNHHAVLTVDADDFLATLGRQAIYAGKMRTSHRDIIVGIVQACAAEFFATALRVMAALISRGVAVSCIEPRNSVCRASHSFVRLSPCFSTY